MLAGELIVKLIMHKTLCKDCEIWKIKTSSTKKHISTAFIDTIRYEDTWSDKIHNKHSGISALESSVSFHYKAPQ